MKKINLLIAITALIFASCDKDEANGPSNSFETTAVMAVIESGNNADGRSVNRPGSVLDWIDTIEVTAEHIYDINQPNPSNSVPNGGTYYTVSEEYTMVDDNSGDQNFILEDVALGRNKFTAFAKSYNQTPALEYGFVSTVLNETAAEKPWEWVDAQRLRVPNTNFFDIDNPLQDIVENPAAGENTINFDMQAESGRLIVAIRLAEKVRNTMNSNFVYLRYRVDGGAWSDMKVFDDTNRDDLLTFYWSDNNASKDGACVEFEFNVCDWVPGLVTNQFYREICIQNGKSIGCVYEVEDDAVVEDITEMNFTFDWEEIDCVECPGNEFVVNVQRYEYIQERMLELCGEPEGSHIDISDLVDPAGNWAERLILNLDGTPSNISMVLSGRDRSNPVVAKYGSLLTKTVPVGKTYLIVSPANATYKPVVDNFQGGSVRTSGELKGCN